MAAGSIQVPTIVPLRKPGTLKSTFSSATLIELATTTSDMQIFYTIDGSKPDPFRKIGTNNTYIYKKPFQLPAGKRSIKAVAVSSDGNRQSNVVTKTFNVEQASAEDEIAARQRFAGTKLSKSMIGKILSSSTKTDGNDLIGKTRDLNLNQSNHEPLYTGPKHLNNRLGNNSLNKSYEDATLRQTSNTYLTRTETPTQATKLLKQASYLHCMYCSAPRPSDPFARFCNECGAAVPPLPTTKLPADEGQVSMCVHCKSLVPMHAQKCIVCEASIPQQKQPPTHVTGKEQQICSSCGTVNPVGLDICVTCEARLNKVTKTLNTSTSAPPVPTKEGCLLQCSNCSRINNSDARFCDWCGAKPKQTASYITCSKCYASCHPYAKFCNSCGCSLGPPERLDARNSNLPANLTKALQHADRKESNDNQWITVTAPPALPQTKSIHTQTQGLFYPSNKSIANQSNGQNSREDSGLKERKPILKGTSPGKGFWRKQTDHICGHFRVHVQNNSEFRKIIGEPKLGKLLAATVHEDIDDMTISITFEVKQEKKTDSNKKAGGLSLVTETEEKPPVSANNKEKKKSTKAKGFSVNKKETLSVENRLLFKEISQEGEGRIEEVQHLIEEGADPNCKNNEQVPVLAVAIQNHHFDCIPVLIQEGADINAKVSVKGNTILHEAVHLGPSGIKAVEILLECGVDIKLKNGAGETAYDIAIKTSNDKAISLLASHSGKSLLNNLIKIK